MFCNTVQALPKCEGSKFEWTDCKGTRIYDSFSDGGAGTFEGKFYDTLRHGKGTMTYLNGDKYVGSWKLGSKDGYGKYYYKDRSSIPSIWINGRSIGDIFLFFSPFLIITILFLLLKFFANRFYLKLTNPIKRIIFSILKDIFNNMKMKKILDFKGRASRLEYWSTHLIVVLFSIIFLSITSIQVDIKIIGVIFAIPIISVTVRRMHDVGISAFMLIPLLLVIFLLTVLKIEIKMISRIVFIIYFVVIIKKSQQGINEYGPNPKIKKV